MTLQDDLDLLAATIDLAASDRATSPGDFAPERAALARVKAVLRVLSEPIDVPLLTEDACRPILEAGFDLGYAACGVEHCGEPLDAGASNPFRAPPPTDPTH
jgi:hypothetical protein